VKTQIMTHLWAESLPWNGPLTKFP